MTNTKLRGVSLAHVVTQNNEATTFVRINVRADLTEALAQELGWGPIGPHQTSGGYDNEMGKGRLHLQSEQQALGAPTPELELEFEECGTFRVVQVKNSELDTTRNEVRFHVRSTSADAAGLCQEYKRNAKKGLGSMEIAWGEQPKTGTVKKEVVLTPVPEGRISLVDGMKIGGRGKSKAGKQREQLAAAAAANGPTVSVEDDGGQEATAAAIAASLGASDGAGYEEMA